MYEPSSELRRAAEAYVNLLSEEDIAERRMDIIGQNGNEGLHYRTTEEDESEFDDYGARIVTDSSFEWGDTPEDDDLFEGIEPNEALKKAAEKYKKNKKK
jgi:hypothetical protein